MVSIGRVQTNFKLPLYLREFRQLGRFSSDMKIETGTKQTYEVLKYHERPCCQWKQTLFLKDVKQDKNDEGEKAAELRVGEQESNLVSGTVLGYCHTELMSRRNQFWIS